MFSRRRSGLAVNKVNPRRSFSSSAVRTRSRIGFSRRARCGNAEEIQFADRFFLLALFQVQLQPTDPFFHRIDVRQQELGVDQGGVPDGIHGDLDVRDAPDRRTPEDVKDGVHLAHLTQIMASQPLALAGPAGQRHEVDKFDGRGGELFGLEERGEMVQARVGDLHHGHVGFLGALVPDVRTPGAAQ
jgi:hypothetical protein